MYVTNKRIWQYLIFSCILLPFSVITSNAQCDYTITSLPSNWQSMEIEAKWSSDEATYHQIVSDFYDNAFFEGYTANVRWGGISRRYIDTYYDNPSNELLNDAHSLRLRIRSESNSSSNDLSVLQNAFWYENWRKVQYKSTPIRYGAVWLREEQGDCEIQSECGCSQSNILAGTCNPQHDAIRFLLTDHPGFDFSSMVPKFTVEDYRYRIELKKNGIDYYEISLDRIVNGTTTTYEVELEIIKAGFTLEDLDELFRLVGILESNPNYNITPSVSSKGGVILPETNYNLSLNGENVSASYRARNEIHIEDFNLLTATSTDIQAGSSITFYPNFETSTGAVLNAEIADCTSNDILVNTTEATLRRSATYPVSESLNESANKKVTILTERELVLFPNPSEGIVTLGFTRNDSYDEYLATVKIFNMNGEEVKSFTKVVSGESIDLSSIYQGAYIVQVILEDETVVSESLIKIN